jgi:nitrogen fixation protein NifU and related proteins
MSMSASNLYTQGVIDHQRAPRNFGALDDATHAAEGTNPLCGDSLRIELRISDGRIALMRFRGEACAIAIATTSMLSEVALGKSAQELAQLQALFTCLVNGEIAHDDALAELNAMSALAQHVARRKCALLPFAALRAALGGVAIVTTEDSEK